MEEIPLTEKQLDSIAEKLINKVQARHHDFWIDPEQHYQDHMALREVVQMIRSGQSIFWKAFLGFLVVGMIVLASIGMAGKVLGK